MYVLQANLHHIKFITVNVPSKWMDILNLKFITTFWVYGTWIIWFVDNTYDTFIMLLWCFPDMLELDRHHTQFTFIKWTRTAGIFFKYSPFGLCWKKSVMKCHEWTYWNTEPVKIDLDKLSINVSVGHFSDLFDVLSVNSLDSIEMETKSSSGLLQSAQFGFVVHICWDRYSWDRYSWDRRRFMLRIAGQGSSHFLQVQKWRSTTLDNTVLFNHLI